MSRSVTIVAPQLVPSTLWDSTFQTSVNSVFAASNRSCTGSTIDTSGNVYALAYNTSTGATNCYKWDSSGVLQTAWTTAMGTAWNGRCLLAVGDSAGQIYIGGDGSAWNGTSGGAARYLRRFTSSGTLTTAYTGFNGQCKALAEQSNGSLVVGGQFNQYNGNTRNFLIRMTNTGTDDTTFATNLGTGFNSYVYAIAIQSDQKIVVGGQFTSLNGNTRNYIVRLNTDGTEDGTFYTNLGSAFNAAVWGITIQPDQKIVVCGQFSTRNGSTSYNFARINTDGTPDTTFWSTMNPTYDGTGPRAVAMYGTDIFAAGAIPAINSITANNLTKFTSTGALDSSYNNLSGLIFGATNNPQYANVTVDSTNGYVYMGGDYTTFNGNAAYQFAKFNAASPTFTTSWTAPAGVTQVQITILPTSGSGTKSVGNILTVVPNTTYTITINSSSYVLNNSNTFGSLFTWTGSNAIQLNWVE